MCSLPSFYLCYSSLLPSPSLPLPSFVFPFSSFPSFFCLLLDHICALVCVQKEGEGHTHLLFIALNPWIAWCIFSFWFFFLLFYNIFFLFFPSFLFLHFNCPSTCVPLFKLLHKVQQQRKQRKQACIVSLSRQTDHYLFPWSLLFTYHTHKPYRQPYITRQVEAGLKIYFHTPQSQNALFLSLSSCPAGALEPFFFVCLSHFVCTVPK